MNDFEANNHQWNGSEHNRPYSAGQTPVSGNPPVSSDGERYNEIPGQFQYLFKNQQPVSEQPSEPPKKQKKHRGRRFAKTSGIVALCMILSLGAGFGGGYAAIKLFGGSNTVLYQAVPEQNNITGTSSGTSSPVADVVSRISPTVVEITTEVMTTGSRLQQYITTGAGSGVIITQDGFIVTNNHVINGASKITVTLYNGEKHDATLIGTDSKTDLAVLKIDVSGLTPAVFGDSDSLLVGEDAIVIGNPLGQLGGTVTNGIISAKSRDVTIDGETMNLLQTNAAVNPGNSGGGLFDNKGNLIGIVNAKSSGSDVEGLGFAIPINTARIVIEDLITKGYVSGRPSMGVMLLDILDFQTAMRYQVNRLGTYVSEVTEGSGAEKAGLRTGDYILSAEGKEIASSTDLKEIIDGHNVGDTVNLTILRGGSVVELPVVLGEYSPAKVSTKA